jgi:hypothetical protein
MNVKRFASLLALSWLRDTAQDLGGKTLAKSPFGKPEQFFPLICRIHQSGLNVPPQINPETLLLVNYTSEWRAYSASRIEPPK